MAIDCVVGDDAKWTDPFDRVGTARIGLGFECSRGWDLDRRAFVGTRFAVVDSDRLVRGHHGLWIPAFGVFDRHGEASRRV